MWVNLTRFEIDFKSKSPIINMQSNPIFEDTINVFFIYLHAYIDNFQNYFKLKRNKKNMLKPLFLYTIDILNKHINKYYVENIEHY